MRKLSRWFSIIVLLFIILGCNPIKEIRDAREAAEKANHEAKMVLEKIKEYSGKAEAAAQKAEAAAQKAEAASQKAVGAFEKRLKK